jgi:hypothetical protein
MSDLYQMIEDLTLDESKELLLHLAQEIFSILHEDEKREFILKMAGRTGRDKIGSMVQL